MKLLELLDLAINKKTAAKVLPAQQAVNDLVTAYVCFDDGAQLLETYLGKLTGSSLRKLREAVFDALDAIGNAGDTQVPLPAHQPLVDAELFGEDLAEVIRGKLDPIRRAAELRTLFLGQSALVDYNWSVRLVAGSDQLRNATLFVVVLEFLLLNAAGQHERKILELSQEEFTRFFHKLQALGL